MVKEEKLNVIFDATILTSGLLLDACRSGIYFTAYNILKEMIKIREVNVVLCCNIYDKHKIQKYISKYFPNYNFEIIPDKPQNPKISVYEKIKEARSIAKEENEFFLKNILQIFMLLFTPIIYRAKKKYYNRVIKKYEHNSVIFSPVYVLPKMLRQIPIKKYTMLYDTTPLLFKEYFKLNTWFNPLLDSLNFSDNYFVISESAKNDFLRFCPQIDRNKIYTTLLACNKSFEPKDKICIDRTKLKYDIPLDKKYVFSLCTLEPRKNLIRAVKTFIEFIKKNDINDLYFVLGGGHWEEFIGILEKEIADLGYYKDRIIKAGYINDNDLPALYSGAEWFVYTSQYEGFGLPPLEAMSCGCPVITSNNSSLPEVVGDAGIMIDWDSDEQHIEAYEKYYFNKELRAQNYQKGLERAKLFSWKKCVQQMIEVMKKDLK